MSPLDHVGGGYDRSAAIGSARLARRAGKYDAASATTPSTVTVTPKT